MRALLISTYELGRQPFGLASAAAWLRDEGVQVTCRDLAVERLDEAAAAGADLIALYVPMHTATRIAAGLIPRLRRLNPAAHLCCFGLYAPLNAGHLRSLGVGTFLGGEFETGLRSLARRLQRPDHIAGADQPEPTVSLDRQQFLVPDRSGLPALERYARLKRGEEEPRTVGSTEASRGCKYRCRHCPIVPVYQGRFRVVQARVVLEDIRRQVDAGAEHITFGDPDFLNGPSHAASIVRSLQRQHPSITYDVTVKVEHLLKHRDLLPLLRDTGCLFVTTAVESLDDEVLRLLDKGHTHDDFLRALDLCRRSGLLLHPTFVPFAPWTSLAGYRDLLQAILDLDLVEQVAPIQYAIRLLITAASPLLEIPLIRSAAGDLDPGRLVHPWVHPEPRVEGLGRGILRTVHDAEARGETRPRIFRRIWEDTARASEGSPGWAARITLLDRALPRAALPYLTEPWYC